MFSVSVLFSITAVAKVAGDKETFAADGVSFNMVYVPGGLASTAETYNNQGNVASDDTGIAQVGKAYFIGETEVTYELWYKVRTWAEKNGYTFANKGSEGGGFEDEGTAPTAAKNQPVTWISWRDAMLFSNALTGWYNATNKTNYKYVYCTDRFLTKPIKTVDNNVESSVPDDVLKDTADVKHAQYEPYTKAVAIVSANPGDSNGTQDGPYVNDNADGFRMLYKNEWVLASRYIGTKKPTEGTLKDEAKTTVINGVTYYWTPCNYASGAKESAYDKGKNNTNEAPTKAVAWYGAHGTDVVKGTRKANALGVYDMSGNVDEWIFDRPIGFPYLGRSMQSSDWYHEEPRFQQMCGGKWTHPRNTSGITGFRLARTAN